MYRVLIRILGSSLLGIGNYPPKLVFDEMIDTLDQIDEAMTLLDVNKIKELEPLMMERYSSWLYTNNIDTIKGEHSIIPYLLSTDTDLKDVNVANAFLVTPNLTKLVYLSVIFLCINRKYRNRLIRALKIDDYEYTNRIYMELCRLFIPTNIPR